MFKNFIKTIFKDGVHFTLAILCLAVIGLGTVLYTHDHNPEVQEVIQEAEAILEKEIEESL